MPDDFKEAILTPLLKKALLDPEIFKNFRPISNLAYISKLIEKCVVVQVTEHAVAHDLLDPDQSAYKEAHSTETTLLRVHNDILCAIDQGKAVVLVLLDLSAAFDTVDHDILLHRLRTHLGITGTALKWFRSYLSNRKQTVINLDASSVPQDLLYGVPQGSVSGPFLFSVNLLPLRKILKDRKVPYKLYADDNQIYLIFNRSDAAEANGSLESVVTEVREWLITNFQQVNDTKTEMIIFSSMHLPPVVFPEFHVGEEVIHPAESVRNLGVMFDSQMRMDKQIRSTVKLSFASLKDMYQIRSCLPTESTKTMVHAFISSRLDYCNSLLYGLPVKQIKKLQAIQNTAARLITHTRKYDHITPVLIELHWLPVQQRIIYKILLFTFKCLHGLAPLYLCDLLTWKQSRGLRSDNKLLLVIPKSKQVTYGDRAFSNAAPRLWNPLPDHVKRSDNVDIFKCRLKTHLFKLSYHV